MEKCSAMAKVQCDMWNRSTISIQRWHFLRLGRLFLSNTQLTQSQRLAISIHSQNELKAVIYFDDDLVAGYSIDSHSYVNVKHLLIFLQVLWSCLVICYSQMFHVIYSHLLPNSKVKIKTSKFKNIIE